MKEWIFLIFGGIIGYFLNLFFYLKSQKSSSEKNLDRIFDLYNKAIDSNKNDDKFREIKEEIKNSNKLSEIHNALVEVKAKLDNNPNQNDAIKYKLLGDKWSTEYLNSVEPNILTKDGKLYFENLLEFHKSIFPGGFPWAGKFRDHDVLISSNFMTIADFETSSSVNYNLKPIGHLQVLNRLQSYCGKWNTNVVVFLQKTEPEKIKIIAEYFHEFQVIHPFTDGNGRVGRVLLGDMVEYLLNKKLDIKSDREAYYNSLRLADLGNSDGLIQFIADNIE